MNAEVRFSDVVLTSVPGRDAPLVSALLPGAHVLEEPLSTAVADGYRDARVLCVMVHDPVSPGLLGRFPHLRGVVTRSTGFDHLPLAWLRERRVEACYLPDYAVAGVAHLTVGLILTLLRRVPEAMAVTQGAFRGGREPPSWDREGLVGRHLHDVTVGVLGTGRIGSVVVRLLSAMGGRVVGHDIAPEPSLRGVPGFRYVDELASFLSACDVLTLHVPLTSLTHGMIGEDALRRLPPGAVLVNTARGRVVDQLAVERALRDGRLGGYAADVLPGEPVPPSLPRFRDLPNVVLTPHLGAYDSASIRARCEHTARAVEAVLRDDVRALTRFRVPPV